MPPALTTVPLATPAEITSSSPLLRTVVAKPLPKILSKEIVPTTVSEATAPCKT
jgi:hypothetical protein